MPSLIARERLGALAAAVDAATDDLRERKAVERLRSADHTLWQDDPTEVADRVGWMSVIDEMRSQIGDLDAFAADVRDSGLRHAVLLGMGGSSLFPEVLRQSFGGDLHVLDTTDPNAIARVPADDVLFVAASKSGSTIETRTQLEHFWELTGGDGARFAVVTDPGSELADLARDRGMRRTFENRPDIGGRYSALSYFGLVPGALIGAPIDELLDRALGVDLDDGLRLAAVMAAAAQGGHDKLTIVLPPAVESFGLWLEQLVAESTGKRGVGIVPVVGEHLGSPDVYGDDRLFVSLRGGHGLDELVDAGHPVVELAFTDVADLGGQVVLWEVATALAGALLGINPFDQPDVAAAKTATTRVLEEGMPDIDTVAVQSLLDQVRPGDYLAIQAFADPGDPVLEKLERARLALRDGYRVATTLGLGPRFLHSTGQLHKGGPPSGVFLQFVAADRVDVPIPGRPYTFSFLKQAQAAGDLLALQERGLRAGRIDVHDLLEVTT